MATISTVNGKKITKIKYKGEIFDTGGGNDWLKEFLDETKDAKFVLYVSKLESDIQAKKYEMDGYFTLENALKDIEYYPEDIKNSIKPQVENASDGWILFDRRYYEGNDDFVNLSNKVQGLK